MKNWTRSGFAALVVCAMAMVIFEGCAAQDTSCVNQLLPCLNYLNGTLHPPERCCDPLKSVIRSNPDCLCTLISNQGSDRAERAGVNVNEAQQLPARCGEHVNPLACLTGSSNVAAVGASSDLQLALVAIMSAIFQFL